jgi:hypothetical protein
VQQEREQQRRELEEQERKIQAEREERRQALEEEISKRLGSSRKAEKETIHESHVVFDDKGSSSVAEQKQPEEVS